MSSIALGPVDDPANALTPHSAKRSGSKLTRSRQSLQAPRQCAEFKSRLPKRLRAVTDLAAVYRQIGVDSSRGVTMAKGPKGQKDVSLQDSSCSAYVNKNGSVELMGLHLI